MATRMITRTPTRAAALAYLREGDVRIVDVRTPGDTITPTHVEAIVHGHRSDYLVRLDASIWSSTYRCETPERCPHLLAVQTVTGHGPAARGGER